MLTDIARNLRQLMFIEQNMLNFETRQQNVAFFFLKKKIFFDKKKFDSNDFDFEKNDEAFD